MPQTLNDQWKQDLGENFLQIHDAWVNNMGNLTLTGRNSEFGNKSFKEKRDMLEEGFRYRFPIFESKSRSREKMGPGYD